MRYAAKNIAMEEEYEVKISNPVIEEVLGPCDWNVISMKIMMWLVWLPVWLGPVLVVIFCLLNQFYPKEKGALNITGNLGKVMKESATIALEYIKSNADTFEIDPEVFTKYNVHIHIPEGATPKDGPSAGITMLTSLVSLFTQRKVKKVWP